jgi:type IV pilus assembly protein PilB
MHSAVIARIKILCGLRLDEKRKPQDGRFSVKYQGHKIDFRTSTFPGYYGEKVVIRVLDSYRGVKKLEDIGLSERHLKQIRAAIERPFGMVLISGPTGSGKTTTLYSMLNELDRDKRNVVSLEDPVEYNIPSMNQSQIFPEIGYTFATGLRSILRQDPDVIMVGEIRDAETAELAIQAALTGHLVFSTIHTNNSIGVITRLIDMGVDPFLIAPTINLAIAQRLVHRIVPGAEKEIEDVGIKEIITKSFEDLPMEYKKDLPLDKNPHNAQSISSNPSGLKGRMPVFEILEIDKEIENLIMHKASEEDI